MLFNRNLPTPPPEMFNFLSMKVTNYLEVCTSIQQFFWQSAHAVRTFRIEAIGVGRYPGKSIITLSLGNEYVKTILLIVHLLNGQEFCGKKLYIQDVIVMICRGFHLTMMSKKALC